MAGKIECCKKPCLSREWDAGRYGFKCTNCNTFTPDGKKKKK